MKPGQQWQGNEKPTAKLTPSDYTPPPGYSDEFGAAVATDGNIVVVGATNNDNLTGEAYVCVKPAQGWSNMTETAQIHAPTEGLVQPSVFLGFPVVISGQAILMAT